MVTNTTRLLERAFYSAPLFRQPSYFNSVRVKMSNSVVMFLKV
jgi:hypothetical protein